MTLRKNSRRICCSVKMLLLDLHSILYCFHFLTYNHKTCKFSRKLFEMKNFRSSKIKPIHFFQCFDRSSSEPSPSIIQQPSLERDPKFNITNSHVHEVKNECACAPVQEGLWLPFDKAAIGRPGEQILGLIGRPRHSSNQDDYAYRPRYVVHLKPQIIHEVGGMDAYLRKPRTPCLRISRTPRRNDSS